MKRSTPAPRLTHFHLAPKQKQALQRRARANGIKLAEEATKCRGCASRGRHPNEMAAGLERVNRRVDSALAEMKRIRAGSPVARYE